MRPPQRGFPSAPRAGACPARRAPIAGLSLRQPVRPPGFRSPGGSTADRLTQVPGHPFSHFCSNGQHAKRAAEGGDPTGLLHPPACTYPDLLYKSNLPVGAVPGPSGLARAPRGSSARRCRGGRRRRIRPASRPEPYSSDELLREWSRTRSSPPAGTRPWFPRCHLRYLALAFRARLPWPSPAQVVPASDPEAGSRGRPRCCGGGAEGLWNPGGGGPGSG